VRCHRFQRGVAPLLSCLATICSICRICSIRSICSISSICSMCSICSICRICSICIICSVCSSRRYFIFRDYCTLFLGIDHGRLTLWYVIDIYWRVKSLLFSFLIYFLGLFVDFVFILKVLLSTSPISIKFFLVFLENFYFIHMHWNLIIAKLFSVSFFS